MQVKSKTRAAAHGEVFTAEREVKAMCDLVKRETERISSRFLDPACGDGNFLAEVLLRKLAAAKALCAGDAAGYRRYLVLAVSGLYGVELLPDNARDCRKRLYEIWDTEFSLSGNETNRAETETPEPEAVWRCREEVRKILNENIICGDFLTMKREDGAAIVFFEHGAASPARRGVPRAAENFGVNFDVIIGNPPYQSRTRGGVESQATPVYNEFVERAVALNPRFIVMITPARWFNGGFGLASFRRKMLNDRRIRVIHDFFDAGECFPGLQIKGGVCYFKWDRDNEGLCKVYSHRGGEGVTVTERPLLENGLSTFIRFNEAVPIIHKVAARGEPSFSSVVSPRDPFGLNRYENGREIMFKDFKAEPFENSALIFSQGWMKNGAGYADKRFITTRRELVDKYKVYISKAYGAGEGYPHQILNKPFLGEPGTCCNMTYLTIGCYENKETAENVISYIQTRFFRFLVSLLKNTQNAYRQVYGFVPTQDFSEPWTDEKLYAKYGLTEGEINFIKNIIRPF